MNTKKDKYYIITNYYSNSRVRTFVNREEWEEAMDIEAFEGGRGRGDSFVVGYITNDNFELMGSSVNVNTFKKNKVGGHYYATVSSLQVRPIDTPHNSEDCVCDFLNIEDFEEKEEQEIFYVQIIENSEIDENGQETITYIDESGEEYEDEEDLIEENKPSQYLII